MNCAAKHLLLRKVLLGCGETSLGNQTLIPNATLPINQGKTTDEDLIERDFYAELLHLWLKAIINCE